MKFTDLRKELIEGRKTLEDIETLRGEFLEFNRHVFSSNRIDLDELKAFLMICLDYYTYSDSGEVLIPDHNYDMCMQRYYEELGGRTEKNTITFADPLAGSRWEFIPHEIPGMVGTISNKLYSYGELKGMYNSFPDIHHYRFAPKYDGVSVAVKRLNGKIAYAATRYDGMRGQDITRLIVKARFPKWWEDAPDGFYKFEVLVGQREFEELITHKKYANRRSATSGIINTPKNISLGKYLTMVPLLYYNPEEHAMKYLAPGSEEHTIYSPADMMDIIEKILEQIRSRDFPFRTDGVVIYPIGVLGPVNEGDLLEKCFAYKVNTNEGKTRIVRGYMSVGRLGGATPMVQVEPVEVNETIVTDASLGSYAKFQSMNLHEHEEVIVFSAGDVIPQVKLPLIRTNWGNDEDLHMDKHCPYCGHKFTKFGLEYACTNPDCIRVKSGRIANFIDKMGVSGFSDRTIEMLVDAGAIRDIPSLFRVTPVDLEGIPGFGELSARSFCDQMAKLRNTPIPISKLLGSLGIENIGSKKVQKILGEINFRKFIEKPDKGKYYDQMRCAEGIGKRTAEIFVDFVSNNRDLIKFLLNTMTTVSETGSRGRIAFTGFRNSRWEGLFNEIGIEVGDSVTRDTLALITANNDSRSTKVVSAMNKGVPIFQYGDIENVYNALRRGESLRDDFR